MTNVDRVETPDVAYVICVRPRHRSLPMKIKSKLFRRSSHNPRRLSKVHEVRLGHFAKEAAEFLRTVDEVDYWAVQDGREDEPVPSRDMVDRARDFHAVIGDDEDWYLTSSSSHGDDRILLYRSGVYFDEAMVSEDGARLRKFGVFRHGHYSTLHMRSLKRGSRCTFFIQRERRPFTGTSMHYEGSHSAEIEIPLSEGQYVLEFHADLLHDFSVSEEEFVSLAIQDAGGNKTVLVEPRSRDVEWSRLGFWVGNRELLKPGIGKLVLNKEGSYGHWQIRNLRQSRRISFSRRLWYVGQIAGRALLNLVTLLIGTIIGIVAK